MTDNLRDKIANAAGDFLSDNFHAYLEQDVALELADAVLRELGLRQESCPCYHRGPNCGHRYYISDWTIG